MPSGVFGRERELNALDTLLSDARARLSGVVFEGEPGIGKTTLWHEGIARAAASGYSVLSCRTALAEGRLSFAALSDLLAAFGDDEFEALPEPQRRAVNAALLRVTADASAEPRALGTALVSLFARHAVRAPLLLAVDDLQWLDRPSARVLEFALRRLGEHPIAVLATARLEEPRSDAVRLPAFPDGVRRIRLGPLGLAALYKLAEKVHGHALSRSALRRIERASAGNPLYAIELVRAIDAQRGGQDPPVPKDLIDLVARRLKRLPKATRDALLRVSALARPSITVINSDALEPAIDAGIVRVHANGRIEFVHPLFGGAVYASASVTRRGRLHQELVDVATDIEERARHRLLAIDHESDPGLADDLHDAAEHALRRGAVEVAAELEEQAARHTTGPAIRWQRLLRAARHSLRAGDPASAGALCDEVLQDPDASSVRAQALHLRAETMMSSGPERAAALLEEAWSCTDDAAHQAEADVSLAMMFFSGFDLVRAARSSTRAIELARKAGSKPLLAEALAVDALVQFTSGRGVDERVLEQALALEDPEREVKFQMRAAFNVAQVYQYMVRPAEARPLYARLRDRAVARGEEADVPWLLCQLGGTDWQLGHLSLAEEEGNEAIRTALFTGSDVLLAFGLVLRATVRVALGNLRGARADAEEALAISQRTGWGNGLSQSSTALALLEMAAGRYSEALEWFAPALGQVEALGVYEWPVAMALPDAIETLVHVGQLDRARRLAEAFEAYGTRPDRPWAMALGARSIAVVDAAGGNVTDAIAAAERALVAHERLPMAFERGRTLLLLGQLQRRTGARRAARETLTLAQAEFDRTGAVPWSRKAAEDFRRIGVRRAPEDLTESEARVVELVAQGLSNPEIAARLFMSRRTVEANLSRVFQKLSVRSRAELAARVARRTT